VELESEGFEVPEILDFDPVYSHFPLCFFNKYFTIFLRNIQGKK